MRTIVFTVASSALGLGCLLIVAGQGLPAAPDASEGGEATTDVQESAPPEIAFGTGRLGYLEVKADETVIVNDYAAVTSPAAPGERVILVESSRRFAVGDVVLVWQTAGMLAPQPGDPGDIAGGANDPVGRYQLVRAANITAGKIWLDRPLAFAVAAGGGQAVSVPEYEDVVVRNYGTLTGKKWDGRTGGVVALLASRRIMGRVRADGLGFRGGAGHVGFGDPTG